jgi:hypothetical protein
MVRPSLSKSSHPLIPNLFFLLLFVPTGSGIGAGWFLDKVVIKVMGKRGGEGAEAAAAPEGEGPEYFFLCGRWLAVDEEDKKIERELIASDKAKKTKTRKIFILI